MPLPVPLLKRKADSYKGDYGYVCVLGGSLGLSGAVCLASSAALKSGAGLVNVAVPASLVNIFEVKLTEVISVALNESPLGFLSVKAYPKVLEISSYVDVFAIGCGASVSPGTKKLILKIVRDIDRPIVADADALNALSGDLLALKSKKTKSFVATPHLGEFSRLIQLDVSKIKKHRKGLAKDFALKYNLTLVLKGDKTIVTNGKTVYENQTGNPGMATAGSGDVLTGIISGLLAQGYNSFDAAKLGVYLHGLAGDYAAADKTEYCLTANDIIDYLPRAFKSGKK